MALCRTCADYRDEPREEMTHVSIKHRIRSVKTCDSCGEKLSEARGAWEPTNTDN